MNICYCDLCGQPIKNGTGHVLVRQSKKELDEADHNSFNQQFDWLAYFKKVESSKKEICDTCNLVLTRMFELRMQNLKHMDETLLGYLNIDKKHD
jgi:hypothetical protein